MSTLPIVSIIIPTYNRAGFLPTAIQSVFAQTYPNVEIIVVDDGSTDGTKKVIEKFGKNLRYLVTDHRGAAHARNTGMKAAAGKYIAFLDSDDRYLSYKLSIQMAFIEAHPEVGMVCSEFSGAFANGDIEEYHLRSYHDVWKKNCWAYNDIFTLESGNFTTDTFEDEIPYYIGNLFDQVLIEPLIPSNTALFPKSILDRVGYQDERIRSGQDYDFVVGICKYYLVAFLNIPTYVIRHHGDQLSNRHLFEGKKRILAEIEETELLLRVVNKWAYEDMEYYHHNREEINSRLSALYCRLGKKWLEYGDVSKAKAYLQYPQKLGQTKLNYQLYWWLCHAPAGIQRKALKIGRHLNRQQRQLRK